MPKKPTSLGVKRHNVVGAAGRVLVSEIELINYETKMNRKVFELEKLSASQKGTISTLKKHAAAQKREIDTLKRSAAVNKREVLKLWKKYQDLQLARTD